MVDISSNVDTAALQPEADNTIDKSDVLHPIDDIVGVINNFFNGGQHANAMHLYGFSGSPASGMLSGVILQLDSYDQGFLPPRMLSGQRDNLPAIAGLVIFEQGAKSLQFFNGTDWRSTDDNPFYGVSLYTGGNDTITSGSGYVPAFSSPPATRDVGGFWDSANPSRATIPITGYYHVNVIVHATNNTGVDSELEINLRRNGSNIFNREDTIVIIPNGERLSARRITWQYLEESDYIETPIGVENETLGSGWDIATTLQLYRIGT